MRLFGPGPRGQMLAGALLGLWVGAACGAPRDHGGCGGVGHDSDLVGGACLDDRDCVDRCLRGGDYPDGTCAVSCFDDVDCPDGTWCVEKSGGVCLLGCGHDADCRPGYDCKDVKREHAGGDVPVCIDD